MVQFTNGIIERVVRLPRMLRRKARAKPRAGQEYRGLPRYAV